MFEHDETPVEAAIEMQPHEREQFVGMMRFMGCTCEPVPFRHAHTPPFGACIHHEDRCQLRRIAARRWN
jgi:hypothetical protein